MSINNMPCYPIYIKYKFYGDRFHTNLLDERLSFLGVSHRYLYIDFLFMLSFYLYEYSSKQ